jgi:uncharacterized protein
MKLPEEISPALIDYIRKHYALNWNGIHGWEHWLRVCENGLHLAHRNGADLLVVTLFAFTHDMARLNDGRDPMHGPRAAERIQDDLQGKLIDLSPQQLGWLVDAVKHHTLGQTEGDLTVRTCWDSDRLDLGRVGTMPLAEYLCTQEARDPTTIAWAYQRSRGGR